MIREPRNCRGLLSDRHYRHSLIVQIEAILRSSIVSYGYLIGGLSASPLSSTRLVIRTRWFRWCTAIEDSSSWTDTGRNFRLDKRWIEDNSTNSIRHKSTSNLCLCKRIRNWLSAYRYWTPLSWAAKRRIFSLYQFYCGSTISSVRTSKFFDLVPWTRKYFLNFPQKGPVSISYR